MNIEERIKQICKKDLRICSDREIYNALLELTKELSDGRSAEDKGKKLYYISAEFLVGKLLSNNMINLGIFDEVKEVLKKYGKNIADIEAEEPEPSLGNGGLGRLAACFIDSIATLGLNGAGVGLLYHFGLFRQKFEKNMQKELPDRWLDGNNGLEKTDTVYDIRLGNKTVRSRMYNMTVTGYENKSRKLHLFDVESVSEDIVGDGISFDKSDIKENLTLFLYPDDSDEAGRKLRIYQQYFMVSSAARLILDECTKKGCNLFDLPEYAVVQINATHPAMIIPELIRLLIMKGVSPDKAIEAVGKTCAYTNHTILAEALEKWPLEYMQEAVPELIPIIEMLDSRIRRRFDDESVYIIDRENRVHMANMAIHFGFSINGVAALHTDILKIAELSNFYKIYPEKFNNKTNGITFRRWLLKSNPKLADLIEELIGGGFKKNAAELQKLKKFVNNEDVLKRIAEIKQYNKKLLCNTLLKTSGIDSGSVFDIQVKRLHEYKRQQLNVLFLINEYLNIKEGRLPQVPVTAIFGAKAAPAYTIAKDIIHLILCLSQMISEDEEVRKYLNVVMVENYNVTAAERLIPACDISEQISLASKEASGTGNMKFMLNGAVTLGTEDGANVEIHELVGDENIYIFGASSDEVIEKYKKGDYNSRKIYESDSEIKAAVDFITDDRLMKYGNEESLLRLKNELINKDYFMTFSDYHSYADTKRKMLSDYTDRMSWAKKMLINISNSGYFSADRTIEDYNRDIWKLDLEV